jgi:hypothetical protein
MRNDRRVVALAFAAAAGACSAETLFGEPAGDAGAAASSSASGVEARVPEVALAGAGGHGGSTGLAANGAGGTASATGSGPSTASASTSGPSTASASTAAVSSSASGGCDKSHDDDECDEHDEGKHKKKDD